MYNAMKIMKIRSSLPLESNYDEFSSLLDDVAKATPT